MLKLRWIRSVKMADIRIEKWFRITYFWTVTYYLPGDPKPHETFGFTFTLWGARRRALKALAGTLRRGGYDMEPKEANE